MAAVVLHWRELPDPNLSQMPPEELVVAWCMNLRKDTIKPYKPLESKDHTAGTIKTYMSRVAGEH